MLVNNAGLERLTPVGEGGDEVEAVFRRIIEINVIGTQLVTRRALSKMTHGGAIVNTASIWGRVAEPLFGAYVASKHAVIGLTKSWAKELGPRSIRVNAICPGPLRTELLMKFLDTDAKKQRRLVHIPMGRFGEAHEIAKAALFLASSESSFVTGATFTVDGGITASYVTPE